MLKIWPKIGYFDLFCNSKWKELIACVNCQKVHPDSQLVNIKKNNFLRKRDEKQHKIKALTFLEDELTATLNDASGIDEPTLPECNPKPVLATLDNLFDSNSTQSHDATILTPAKHRVYVCDTPIELYGLSRIERKKLGFDL